LTHGGVVGTLVRTVSHPTRTLELRPPLAARGGMLVLVVAILILPR
jgi:hypothetical protein